MKKLEGFNDIGMQTDNQHHVACGMIDGYKFIVNFIESQRQYLIVLTIKGDNTEIIQTYIDSLSNNPVVNWADYQEETLNVNIKNTKGLNAADLESIMRNIAAFCHTNGYVQCCPKCKEEKDIKVCSINGENTVMCSDCFEQYVTQLPPEKTVSLPLGILGGLVGSLIGVIAWVLIYKLGYVAGITGFIMAICCFKGYELLGGRIDKKGVYICIFIAIVMLAFAEMIALGLEIHSAINEYYSVTISEAFSMIPLFLEDGEIIGGVVKDLLSGYLLMAIASYSYIKSVHQKAKYSGINEIVG